MKVTFIERDGTHRDVRARGGVSLMRAATDSGVHGILAECGGACACATCKVIVAPEWTGRLPEPDPLEEMMLELGGQPAVGTRLSCQIRLTDAVDGLTVQVADNGG
jgi:2Fe-2S ferredoxin